jgi:DNA gyrase subunit A
VDEDDVVIGAKITKGQNEVMLVTHEAMCIRFPEEQLRDQGRVTRGVQGIRLKSGDFVHTLEIVDPEACLLIAGENGMGKRTEYAEYRSQSRAGSGVIATKTAAFVAGALSVRENDEIMLLTQSGQAIRSPVKGIRVIGRATQGVRLMQLPAGDKLIGICRIIETEEDEENTPSE